MVPDVYLIQARAYSDHTMMLNYADKSPGMHCRAFDRGRACIAFAFWQHGGKFASIAV